MRELYNLAIRCAGNEIYFFNENGIYEKLSIKEAKERNIQNFGNYDLSKCYLRGYIELEKILNIDNALLIKKALSQIQLGDTVEKFLRILTETKLEKRPKPEGIDRFIIRIDKPIFVRSPESLNPNTFDYIYMDVMIITEWECDRISYIKEQRDEILKRVIAKLQTNSNFNKYGVPVNFLKLSRMTIKKNNVLQCVFELKM